jgi:hypothetical protein
MTRPFRKNVVAALRQPGWWIFFLICALYSGYALWMGGIEFLSLLRIAKDAPHRAMGRYR